MRKLLLMLFILLLTSTAWASVYDYPFINGYEATVLGTPSLYRAALPEKIPSKMMELTVFAERKIPEVFWYQNKFRYSFSSQKGEAPLIFVIAGTGASFYSAKMRVLQKAFYQAGFHVICLSSPTYFNFIVTASKSGVPGNLIEDSRDLYRVMQLAWEQVKDKIKVSEFYLTGYSLGAAQAAFVAKLDEDRRRFNFRKVLMINPPVSLYNSVKILDGMLEDNIPGGLDHFYEFWEEMMRRLSETYKLMGYIEFTENFLYDVYRKKGPPSEEFLAALIGISFRISSENMVFAADVMSNAGFIVPKNRVLSATDPLTDYVKVAARTSFEDYFDGLFYPYFASQHPGISKEALIESMSLKSIELYLQRARKIGLVTNEDDIILAPGELDYLVKVFGARAKIYPNGGHCGNIAEKNNINYIVGFFRNERGAGQ
ncbi:MAG: alpha/beta fold hydrolase [Deltaproteobacteria bacterium]|nr:alpha/beta fold hydrolase [Deltaproteobacteria bacterium]